ncbi:MAG: hypothetical protein ABSB79_08405 [Syntrophales bacterium]|jgi:hypothetical protein
MADYISCVEASGGNRQEIIEFVSEIGEKQDSTRVKASGSGLVLKGSGEVTLDRASERTLAKKLETKWFPKGMSECAKVLDKKTIREIKEIKKEVKTLSNKSELQGQQLGKLQDNFEVLNEQVKMIQAKFRVVDTGPDESLPGWSYHFLST